MRKFWCLIPLWLLLLAALAGAETSPPEIKVETEVEASALEKFMVTTSVFRQKELDRDPSLNLWQYLDRSPGVIMEDTGNRRSENTMHLRGFDMSHIRVYLNGIPLSTPNQRIMDFSILPKEFIREVEVVRGPPPVSYGADAAGGIINLLPRKAGDAPNLAVSLLTGSFNQFIATVSPTVKNKKLDVFVSGRKETSDGYVANASRNLDYALLSGTYALGRNLNAALLYMRTSGVKGCPNEYNPDGSLRPHTSGFWPNSYNWRFQDILLENESVRLEKHNPAGISWSLLAFQHNDNNTLTGWVDPKAKITPPAGKPTQYYQAGVTNYSYWESGEYGGNCDLSLTRGKHALKAGYSNESTMFRQNDNASLSKPMFQWDKDYWTPRKYMAYNGYYLEDTMSLNPCLDVTLGARVDNCNRCGSMGNFNLNLAYTKGAGTWRFTTASTGRFPIFKELDGTGGNPNLAPERSLNFEIGYHNANASAVWDLSVFASEVKDLIGRPSSNDSYKNWSKVGIFGYEISAVLPLGRALQLKPNISYACRDFGNDPPTWDNIPKHKYVLALGSRPRQGGLNWSLDAMMVSDKNTGDANYPTLQGYTLVNCGIAYEIPGRSSGKASQKFSLSARNLFNVNYQTSLYYPEPGTNIWGEYRLGL